MKKLIAIFWGTLTTLIILVALSCDTTKPKPPVAYYELNIIHDAEESNVYADFNITTVNIIAELKDEDGNFLLDKTITFTWENADHAITLGTISTPTMTTDTNGKVSVLFEDNGQAGLVNVTARFVDEYNNITTQSTSFTILPNEDQVSTLTLNSSAAGNLVIVADNAPELEYETTFNAFIRDDLNNPVVNLNVHFSNLTMLGGLLNNQVMTNDLGKASVTLSSLGSELGYASVKAYVPLDELARAVLESPIPLTFSDYDFNNLERSSTEISDTLTVEYILQSQYLVTHQVASLALDAVPEIIQMDDSLPDSVYTITLNATVRDSNGVAVSGVPVHFNNQTPALGTITSTNISTNSNGVASTTLIAGLEDAGDVVIGATIIDPNDPDTPAFSANETVYLRTLSQNIINQAANLSTWIVNGNLPDGNSNTSSVDTLYARVTDSFGGSVAGIPVHFERISGTVGVLSVTNAVTNANGLAKTVFTTLTSEIIEDIMTVSIQISVPGSNLDPQVRTFTFNFEGSELVEYRVNRFEWYKGFSVSNGMVDQLFIGDVDSLSVSSDFEYLLLVASAIDFDGVRINQLPVNFSIYNNGNGANGDLSSALEYTCCSQDSLGGNLFLTSGDQTLLNYVIDPGHPDEASGLVTILYYNQSVNVCDNVISEIHDPFDNSVTLFTNPINICTVEEDVVDPVDLVQNLTFTTNPNNVLLVDGVPDSTYRVVLTATVRDENGVPVSGVPVQFVNHTPLEGILLHGIGYSNMFGYARDTLFVNQEDIGPINLEAIVYTSPTPLSNTRSVGIYDYTPPTLELDHIEAWPKNQIIQIVDPGLIYTDTLYAKALTSGGAIIPSAPLNFALENPNVGSISANQVFTNAEGIASVVFYTSVGIEPGSVEFIVNAPAYPEVAPVHKFIAIVGQSNDIVNSLLLNAIPPQIVVLDDVTDTTYSITFKSTAKDVYGVAVPNIPVYFQNVSPEIGTLNISLAFTDSVGVARTVLNLENDTFGTATIKSYILSSQDNSDTLFTEYKQAEVMTETEWRLQSVTSLLTWPSTNNIMVTRMDSTYCDTLYAVAQNASGGGVTNINVEFSAFPTDLGFISNSEAITDTSGYASTTYCVIPGTLDTSVSISVSIPGSAIPPNTFTIEIENRLPECPDCTAELTLWSDDYVLPAENGSLSTTVYATYSDTLGYGPIDNTIIQFQSFEDSSGTWLPIGSIDPWGQFVNDTAAVTFNMTNDEGIAHIIGNYAGLSDTINIVLNAGTIDHLQFVASYPSEIMVQGGGGIEATEINLEIRDGSDNLVSQEYRIWFEITSPT
ncbi:MAG: Ig-like domain-containing protein, partial [Fidelibacterota bacterium]